MTLTIDGVNNLSGDDFERIFGPVVEHHPECARQVWKERPFQDVGSLISCFHIYLDSISVADKEDILKKHPMLGTKKKMADYSVDEQKKAGLDRLETAEEESIQMLNTMYYDKFSFPFIICVKENNKESIFENLKTRLANTQCDEVHNGIEEVKKIVKHRVLSMFH